MNIIIVYQSRFGHTKTVVEHIYTGENKITREVILLSIEEAQANMQLLHSAGTILFDCPTYFGTVSAQSKKIMETTGDFWYQQLWKNKLAAGFTNSSPFSGDKLNTLQQISNFAAQHSMLWISTGILPQFKDDKQLFEPNYLGSYIQLMTVSVNATNKINPPIGLETAMLFGKRIAVITR
jgi:NAD(P)H dehydrogenase (quinone)